MAEIELDSPVTVQQAEEKVLDGPLNVSRLVVNTARKILFIEVEGLGRRVLYMGEEYDQKVKPLLEGSLLVDAKTKLEAGELMTPREAAGELMTPREAAANRNINKNPISGGFTGITTYP